MTCCQFALSVRDEMNRVLNEVFGRGGSEEGTWFSGAWSPPVDIYETDDALVMKAELPGFTKDDIQIELKENTFVLRGERRLEALEAGLPGKPTTLPPPPPPPNRSSRAAGAPWWTAQLLSS